MNKFRALTTRSKNIAIVSLATVLLGAGGALAAGTTSNPTNGSCCAQNAPCCQPGAPCCQAHAPAPRQ